MKGMFWLIVLLLIAGFAMWFYGKYFGAALNRTSTAVTVTQVPADQSATSTEVPPAVDPEPAEGSSRTGDGIRKTELGRQINQIYSQHNRGVEEATK